MMKVIRLYILISIVALLVGCGGANQSSEENNNEADTVTIPSGISAVAGDSFVSLAWGINNFAESYTIHWGLDPDVTSDGDIFTTESNTLVHRNLINGQTYYYRIQANGNSISSGLSEVISATPQADIVGMANRVTFEKINLPCFGGPQQPRARYNGVLWLLPGGISFCASADGVDWDLIEVELPMGDFIQSITWTGVEWVALTRSMNIVTSKDGKSWDGATPMRDTQLNAISDTSYSIIWAENRFVVQAQGGQWTSLTGDSWSLSNPENRPSGYFEMVMSGNSIIAQGNGRSYISRDNGSTWLLSGLSGMATDGNLYVGSALTVFDSVGQISSDGINWSSQPAFISGTPHDNNIGLIIPRAYFKGRFYGVFSTGSEGSPVVNRSYIYSSADGLSWKLMDHPVMPEFLFLSANDDQIIGYGGTTVVVSDNGEDWFTSNLSGIPAYSRITWSTDRFIVVGNRSFVMASVDGYRWSILRDPSPASNDTLRSAIWTGMQYIAVGGGLGGEPLIVTSLTGKEWTRQDVQLSYTLYDIAWNGRQLVAVGGNGGIVTSEDGIAWVNNSITTNLRAYNILWSGHEFLVYGQGGTATSNNGIDWIYHDNSVSLDDVTWTGSHYVGVRHNESYLSTDGVSWVAHDITDSRDNQFESIVWVNTSLIAANSLGAVYQSVDGMSWVKQDWIDNLGYGIDFEWSGDLLLFANDKDLYRGHLVE